MRMTLNINLLLYGAFVELTKKTNTYSLKMCLIQKNVACYKFLTNLFHILCQQLDTVTKRNKTSKFSTEVK